MLTRCQVTSETFFHQGRGHEETEKKKKSPASTYAGDIWVFANGSRMHFGKDWQKWKNASVLNNAANDRIIRGVGFGLAHTVDF